MSNTTKRLALSLLVASAVGGCAVYEPYNPNGGTFADAYPYYPYAQPVYPSAPYYAPYYGAPYYGAPPASLNFRYESDRQRHRGDHEFRGDRPGFRRDGVRDDRDGSQRHQDGRAGDGGRRGNRPEAAAPRQPSDQRNDSVWQELRERRSAEGGGR